MSINNEMLKNSPSAISSVVPEMQTLNCLGVDVVPVTHAKVKIINVNCRRAAFSI
jgi:hypothetical protein